MCRHIYDWNIVNCDVKRPIHLTSPWLSGDVPRLLSYGIYISRFVRFARYCTSVLISILKIFKSLQNFWHRVTDITSFGKRLGSSLGHTLNFCPNLLQYRFRIMYNKEPLTLSSTVVLSTNFGGSKVKRISSRRARENACDVVSTTHAIIERTIGLVLGLFTALYIP